MIPGVMERTFDAHRSTKPMGQGTGLRLIAVRCTVRALEALFTLKALPKSARRCRFIRFVADARIVGKRLGLTVVKPLGFDENSSTLFLRRHLRSAHKSICMHSNFQRHPLEYSLGALLAWLILTAGATGTERSSTSAIQPAPPQNSEPASRDAFVSWKNGLRFEVPEKAAYVRLGLRVQNDWSFRAQVDEAVEQNVGPIRDTVDFRRIWLELNGVFEERTHWAVNLDLAGGRTAVRNLYAGINDVPWIGTFRVGHQLEPFGLDELNSNAQLVFAERSLSAFYPSYHAGVRALRTLADQRMTLSYGIFRDTDETGRVASGDGYNLSARATGLLVHQPGDNRWLHVGVATSRRVPPEGVVHYRVRPENRWVPPFAQVTNLPADEVMMLGLEAASAIGPFSIQAEFVSVTPDTKDDDPTFTGYYLQASYMLTGESRSYDAGNGVVGRIVPRRPFGREGSGAWEIAARLANVDLNDASIRGGEVQSLTAALNWYLNANVRAMFNWIHVQLDEAGDAHLALVRVQVAF